MGTKFIATRESMAEERHKQMLVDSSADDVLLTTAFTGLQTNMLRPSIVAAGLDPDNLPPRGPIGSVRTIDIGARENRPKRCRDIWSGGHSTSGVTGILSVDDLVALTAAEYRSASRVVQVKAGSAINVYRNELRQVRSGLLEAPRQTSSRTWAVSGRVPRLERRSGETVVYQPRDS
jgi:hypothetical protein